MQLPYFTKEPDDCETVFEKIIYVLKHMDILERMPWMAQNAVFQRLSEIAEVSSLTKEERVKYDAGLKAYRDTIAVMEGQYELGMEKGILITAKKLKQMGLSVEDIKNATGLSAEEIEAL